MPLSFFTSGRESEMRRTAIPDASPPSAKALALVGKLKPAISGLLWTLSSLATAASPGNVRPADWVSIRTNPGFKHFLTNLQQLVDEEATQRENHFFVSKHPKGTAYAYMVWKEGRALWIMELGDGTAESWRWAVLLPRRRLNLDKDVVPTPDDMGSSSYLVDRTWTQRVVYDAVIEGDLFLVVKKASAKPTLTR